MLKLERIFYPEIHSSVNIQEKGSMEIENRFSLNVNFDNKNQKCISTFEIQSVCKAHEDWFNVGVKIVGIFKFIWEVIQFIFALGFLLVFFFIIGTFKLFK